ncbi:MAG: hypothetical protein H8E66_03205 [Planctomycetes bacterium]|nr:hypothetical protein [Planctomycetota bacterium]
MNTLMLLTLSLSATTQLPDGTLLVMENSSKAVARVTGSRVTHVAMIFNHDDTAWVYEATPAKVRRLTLTDYRDELGALNRSRTHSTVVSILEPKYPYSEMQIGRMQTHAASQIGRRYSIKGYVRGNEFDGIHCAHLAAETLEKSGRCQFDREYAITPGELVTSITPLYKRAASLAVEPSGSSRSWCDRSWTTWFNYGTWCRWACYESWTFCW